MGAGVGALIGAVEDFTVQLLQNGDDLQCVDGGSIATSAAIGALPLGSALGILSKTGRLRSFLGRFATKGLADPKNIRFTQDSIGTTFRDGRPVQGLIDGLKSGKVSPSDLPPIRTFQKDGLTFSLDNRRLFAAGQAGVKVRTVPATAQELAKELPRKFTTPNQGCIICVRGSLE